MAITNRGHLQTRLQNILSSIDSGTGEPFLYTKYFDKEKLPSLVFLFDNGIDPDPAYSGTLLGRIFLDAENNLSLASWPNTKQKHPPWRKELLIPKVQSFQFEFLGKRTDLERQETITPITPNLAWRTAWPKSQTSLPSIIRLTLKEEKEKEPLRFAFILPTPDFYVSYTQQRRNAS